MNSDEQCMNSDFCLIHSKPMWGYCSRTGKKKKSKMWNWKTQQSTQSKHSPQLACSQNIISFTTDQRCFFPKFCFFYKNWRWEKIKFSLVLVLWSSFICSKYRKVEKKEAEAEACEGKRRPPNFKAEQRRRERVRKKKFQRKRKLRVWERVVRERKIEDMSF